MKKRNLLLIGVLGASAVLGLWAVSVVQDIRHTGCLPPPQDSVPLSMGESRSKVGFHLPPLQLIISAIAMPVIPAWWEPQPNPSHPVQLKQEGSVEAMVVKNDIAWTAFDYNILQINLKTGETRDYQILGDGGASLVIEDIFQAANGSLWVFAFSSIKDYVALAEYDPSTDQFKVVTDRDGVFQQRQKQDNTAVFVSSQVLAQTPDGKLILPFEGQLMAYDPALNQLEPLLSPEFVTNNQMFSNQVSALLVSDNKVWFSMSRDKDLRSLDLKTHQVTDYGHVPSFLDDGQWSYMQRAYQPLAIDGLGRIWMGYFSRLKNNPDGTYTWEPISLPPHFVINFDPDYAYVWASLLTSYTSSDGEVWFITEAGLIKYNPTTDQWCKSMAALPPFMVADDGDGNMWLAVNDREYHTIFKTPLLQK